MPIVNQSVWKETATMYILTSCPPGYQLINSTDGDSSGIFSHDSQECKACKAGQYIIDPNTDSCQLCPAGKKPKVPHSFAHYTSWYCRDAPSSSHVHFLQVPNALMETHLSRW